MSKKFSISTPSDKTCSFWSDFLIFKDSDSNVALNRSAGDFPLHTHEFTEITFILSGQAKHIIDGVNFPIKQGDFVITEPGSMHSYSESSAFTRISIQFRENYTQNLKTSLKKAGFDIDVLNGRFVEQRQSGGIQMLTPSQFTDCLQLIEKMEYEWLEHFQGFTFLLECMAGELISKILRYSRGKEADYENTESHYLSEAAKYIDAHYREEISSSYLEKIARMSKRTFIRRFKEETGYSPKQYILKTRIAWACRMLSAPYETIQNIASESGFIDQNYFSRAFKKTVGTSPMDYAKKVSKTQS